MTNATPKLNGVLKFEPWGWMPGLGFYLDDIDARFWKQATFLLIVSSILIVLLATLIFRMRTVILKPLGGEPQDAAESMKRIANGDMNVGIVLAKDDNTTALNEQVQVFDEVAKSYSETKSEDEFTALLCSVKKTGQNSRHPREVDFEIQTVTSNSLELFIATYRELTNS